MSKYDPLFSLRIIPAESVIAHPRERLLPCRARMRKRNAVEGTHSELVRGYGLRRCRYKGRSKTGLQAQFTATACNLRRWARRLCWEERKMS